MRSQLSAPQRLWLALTASSLVSLGLYGVGVWRNQTVDFWYLPLNIALALIPLLLAVRLRYLLKTRTWVGVLPLAVTFLWLIFLPNSFYILTDFVHLTEVPRVDIVQDIVMLTQFSFTGLAFGFVGLYIVHREMLKRTNGHLAAFLVAVILLLSSFAIYLGRELRWNSWDVFVQPLALGADIAQYVLNPFADLQMIATTLSFFAMLGSMYVVLWWLARGVASIK